MASTLVLVPTDQERRLLAPGLPGEVRLELCGFGPVAAAARTAALLAARSPRSVLLLGIAGRLDPSLRLGGGYRFDRVACDGVGVGCGAEFVSAADVGWPQWPGDPPDPATAVGDIIDLPGDTAAAVPSSGLLLTACAASATAADAVARRARHPAAMAEDMEGYGVALACRLAGVPLAIVRGISNVAGDRDHGGWQVAEALAAAALLGRRILESAR